MPNIESTIVEVCIFKTGGGGPRYLVLRRSAGDRLYPGIWQIVTGSVERGEHAVHAAVRELNEETGLAAKRLWRLPFVNSFYDPVGDRVHLCPHFAAEVEERSEPRLSVEHDAYEWCTLERAQALLPWSGQRTGVGLVHSMILRGTEESRLLEIPADHPERKLP
jgi:8-oxo-dGTP diphosphatase